MRAVFALSQALSEYQPHAPAMACGLIVQFPFSCFCVQGAKKKELRKGRAPPSKVNRIFFILESATTTTFDVHADCTSEKARRCPRSAIGTVYLEGSYLVQEHQLTETLAKELCLSLGEKLQKQNFAIFGGFGSLFGSWFGCLVRRCIGSVLNLTSCRAKIPTRE